MYNIDSYAVAMAMAEEYDNYMSWPIKWFTDFMQDYIIENYLDLINNSNRSVCCFGRGDIGPVNIHIATALCYAYESTLAQDGRGKKKTFITPEEIKKYIKTDQGAIEFSALIMKHVIEDLNAPSSKAVFPEKNDCLLTENNKRQIYVNAFRAGIKRYFELVQDKMNEALREEKKYETDPQITPEELMDRYEQIKSVLE